MAGRPRAAPAAAVAEGRGPRACGPSGCRGRCARPWAGPRAQLLFKGPVGHVARTQLAAAGQELRGWAAPLRRHRRRRQRAAPTPTGRPELNSRTRAAMAEAAPARVSALARGRPDGPGRRRRRLHRVGPRGSGPGGVARPRGAASSPPPAPPARARRVRPTRSARPLLWRPRPPAGRATGRPKRQAGRRGARQAAPTSGAGLGFLVTLPMTRLAFEERGRSPHPLSHWRSSGSRGRRGEQGRQPRSVVTTKG